MRSLTSKPRLLNTAKGRDLGRNDPGVHAHDAVFQRLGHLGHAPQIAGIEVTGQAENSVIGLLNYIVDIAEPEQGCKRTKCLFHRNLHVAGHTRHQLSFQPA